MLNPMLKQLQQSSEETRVPTRAANATGNAGPMTQIRQAMDYVRANGGDARTAFYRLAQQKGVDPGSVLRGLR